MPPLFDDGLYENYDMLSLTSNDRIYSWEHGWKLAKRDEDVNSREKWQLSDNSKSFIYDVNNKYNYKPLYPNNIFKPSNIENYLAPYYEQLDRIELYIWKQNQYKNVNNNNND
eukprot:UN04869